MGFTDLKNKKNVEGADSVYIEGPTTGFGEIRTSRITPQGQGDFVHGVSNRVFTTSSFAGGTVAAVDGVCELDSGTNANGSATVQLRRGLKYRPGQATLMRITALYDDPDAGNAQFVGAGTAESGYFVGYFGTNFGILHSQTAQREVRTYTVTTGEGTANVTVTLDGDSVVVPVTGGSDLTQTAYQLSLADYSQVGRGGWLADVVGDTVYFVSARASSQFTGSYSIAGTTIAGTFSRHIEGLDATNTFIPSSSFNVDKLDGTGPSGMVFDPQMGNVFEISFQYLGFGNCQFSIEDPEDGKFTKFHQIKNANSRITPVLKNPNVAALATSANIGGTTNVKLKTASIGGFIEGDVIALDPKFAKTFTFSGVDSPTYKPLFLLKANRLFNGKSCFGEIDILRILGANTVNNKALTIGLFLGAEVTGDVNFQNVAAVDSIASYASLSPTTQTITNLASLQPFHEVLVGSDSSAIDDVANLRFAFGVGRTILVAIKTTGPVDGAVGINWFEQQ